MRETLGVALVGKRAGAFLAGFSATIGVRIVAVCERDASARDALGTRAGVSAEARYSDYGRMLADARPDAVAIGTPMDLHAEQSIIALGLGIHVLSEVTAAVTIDECRVLASTARRAALSGVQYMLAENACFRRELVLVRALASSGRFGSLYYAEGEYLHDVKHLHRNPDGSPTWRATWQVGKRGATYSTHSLGPVLDWFGPDSRVETVACHGTGVWTDPALPHDDSCLMICNLANGGLVRIRLDMMSNRPESASWYQAQGTLGVYEAARGSAPHPVVWFGDNAPDPKGSRHWSSLWDYEDALPGWMTGPLARAAFSAGHGGGDFWVAHTFADALLKGMPVPIGIDRALAYTVPGLVSETSIEAGGTPMKVPVI